MTRNRLNAALAALFALSACSSIPLFPEMFQFNEDGLESVDKLVILGTNDFHGALASQNARIWEPQENQYLEYEVGGAAYFASHIKTLRWEEDNLLLVDAGDHLSGTLDSGHANAQSVVDFYNSVEFDAATIGSQDVKKLRPELLEQRMEQANFPYVVTYDAPNSVAVKSASIEKGKFKIGLLGVSRLTHLSAKEKTELKKAVEMEAKELRKENHVVLLLAHSDISCDANIETTDTRTLIWTIHSPQARCHRNSDLHWLIRNLPTKSIDAVIAGGSHEIVHHWVEGVPVIQAGAGGLYYNLLYLAYDFELNKVVDRLTQIEGPIPVCSHVFANQNNCNQKQPPPYRGRGALVRYELHGNNIYKDLGTQSLLEDTFAATYEKKNEIVGTATRFVRHSSHQESEMANLAADAVREALGADFALINPGSVRGELEPGPISFEKIRGIFPFESTLVKITLTGRQLKNLLQVASNGARGVFGVSGLKLRLIAPEGRAQKVRDLNKDGKLSHWEADRLLSVRTKVGNKIYDRKSYTLATTDFLAGGGDDLHWPMAKIPQSNIEYYAKTYRSAILEYIATHSPLHIENESLAQRVNQKRASR